jgi:hypothetical protein
MPNPTTSYDVASLTKYATPMATMHMPNPNATTPTTAEM